MRQIIWLEVYRRKEGTIDGKEIIQSYPFPFPDLTTVGLIVNYTTFMKAVSKIPDKKTREATENRIWFIYNWWHKTDFIELNLRGWKYD